jgi:hypothetical protein
VYFKEKGFFNFKKNPLVKNDFIVVCPLTGEYDGRNIEGD